MSAYRDPRYPPFKPPTHAEAAAAAELLRSALGSNRLTGALYEAAERARRAREIEDARLLAEARERRWWEAHAAEMRRGPWPRLPPPPPPPPPPPDEDDEDDEGPSLLFTGTRRGRAALLLGVPASATDAEVNAAHRAKILAVHPDLAAAPEDVSARTQQAAQLNAARDVMLKGK